MMYEMTNIFQFAETEAKSSMLWFRGTKEKHAMVPEEADSMVTRQISTGQYTSENVRSEKGFQGTQKCC